MDVGQAIAFLSRFDNIMSNSRVHSALTDSCNTCSKSVSMGCNLPDFTLNYAHYKAGLQGGPNK